MTVENRMQGVESSAERKAAERIDDASMSPYFLDGWREFMCQKWGLESAKLSLKTPDKELPRLDAVLYLDKKGRIVLPPLNPHLPIAFWPSPVKGNAKRYSQWSKVSSLLADEFKTRGMEGTVCLGPEAADVREWQWRGFSAQVRYTFLLKLPLDMGLAHPNLRTKISKASRAGLVCGRAGSDDLVDVCDCLSSTEERKGFSHRLSLDDIRGALNLLGDDRLCIYVCREPEKGRVVAVQIALYAGGRHASGILASTQRAYLKTGAAQLLIDHELRDLAARGATEYDFVGANLPTVSAAKLAWGGELVPYYCLSLPGAYERAYRSARRTGGKVLRRFGLR